MQDIGIYNVVYNFLEFFVMRATKFTTMNQYCIKLTRVLRIRMADYIYLQRRGSSNPGGYLRAHGCCDE